jgi:hypothetical protein
MEIKKNLFYSLFLKETNIMPLVSFRLIFGMTTFISTLRFMLLGWVDLHFVSTQVQFKYFGFEWVPLMPPFFMYALHILMLLASLGIFLGAFYRISSILFFICFTWCELIDITYYLNHYYFVSLMAFLMIFLPANKAYAWDAFRLPNISAKLVPAYCINILKFQLILVYFYAGIAKINYDWLFLAMPLKIWLPANSDMWLLGSLFNYPLTAYIFSWAGMLFDVLVGFFLLFKPTRLYAWLCILFFHSITGYLFQIGVFPLVMTFSTLIFFSDAFHQKIILFWGKLLPFFRVEPKPVYAKSIISHPIIVIALLIWICFHLAFPFRYLLYTGNHLWTEQGYRFGWRVMLFEKAGTATFYVTNAKNNKEGVVDNHDFLNPHQEKQMAMQADMILQYAQFLKNHYQTKGMEVSKVRAEVYVTLNGRPSQLYINPNINLLTLKDSWANKSWINPFEK